MKVYLSIAWFDYEGYSVMCAFKTLRAAKRHAQRCQEHNMTRWQENRPKPPKYFRSADSYDTETVEYA